MFDVGGARFEADRLKRLLVHLSALTANSFRIFFAAKGASKFFRIRSYRKDVCKSFRIRSCEKHRGVPPSQADQRSSVLRDSPAVIDFVLAQYERCES